MCLFFFKGNYDISYGIFQKKKKKRKKREAMNTDTTKVQVYNYTDI